MVASVDGRQRSLGLIGLATISKIENYITSDQYGLHVTKSVISGPDNCNNCSNYDTSNRFGTNILWGSLFKKKTRATQNSNMTAIFQDGRHGILWNVIFCLKNGI